MKTSMFARLVAALLIAAGAPAHAFQFRDLRPLILPACEQSLRPAGARTKLGDEPEVIVAAWNVENVKQVSGRFEPAGVDAPSGRYRQTPAANGYRPLAPWKFAAKQKKIMQTGTLVGAGWGVLPHFVVAPEVESRAAAEDLFDGGPLAGKYRTFLTPGNDTRGIDIAFAVRADLDVTIDFESHVHAKWYDRAEGVEARVFTRDLPVLIISDGRSGRVQLILIGQHAKSMRDRARGRDPHSNALRRAQFAATAEIIKMYRARFGAAVPILMAGDFNTDVRTSTELGPIKSQLTDAFDHLGVSERVTHTYHPPEGPVIPSQLDAVMVSDSVKPFLKRAFVLPEFDAASGRRLGQPTTLEDRTRMYPSDHRAIAVVLDGALFHHGEQP